MRISTLVNLIIFLSGSFVTIHATGQTASCDPGDAKSQEIALDSLSAPVTDVDEYVAPLPQAGGGCSIRNVSRATLLPVLPKSGTGNGTAVIVAPGGAFVGLAIDLEGFRVARELADHGIAAFVLKYRLYPTSAKGDDVGKIAGDLIAKGLSNPDKIMDEQYGPALDDANAAISLIRRDASKWNVDPKRVGIIGFSAGAMTAMSAAIQSDTSKRPDFVGYIYGPEFNLASAADAPPLFAAIALNDSLFRSRGFPVIEAWQRAKRPVELHAYQKGGHGFGLGVPGTTTTLIAKEFTAWMEMNGFLKADVSQVQR